MEANVKDHFSYLLTDESNDFFQKIAVEEATSSIRATTQVTGSMVKKAAAGSVSAFEKVASRLDRDLGMLKHAGACGVNAGMQKRANAYMNVLVSETELTCEEYGQIFDKVASEAIEVDLAAARDQLCADQPAEFHYLVDEVLLKIGHELVELALMEKEAGKLSFLKKLVGKVAPVVTGGGNVRAGLAGAGKMLAGKGGRVLQEAGHKIQKAKHWAGTPVRKLQKWREGRITSAPTKLQAKIDKLTPMAVPGTAKGDVATGMKGSFEKQKVKAEAKRRSFLDKKEKKLDAGWDDGVKTTATPGGQRSAPTATGEKKIQQSEQSRQTGASDAAAAAQPKAPKAPEAPKGPGESGPIPISSHPNHPSNKGTGTDGPAPKVKAEPDAGSSMTNIPASPPGGAEGKSEGFMSSWKKLSEGGWKGLNPAEKGTLIRGGVTAAMVGRAVTGHGVVTGGEGLI
jgi:hypothetical protein